MIEQEVKQQCKFEKHVLCFSEHDRLEDARNYDMMKLTDFYYDLPQELIAQDPLLKRSESRLMVLDRKDNTIEHKHFYDVIDYLNPGHQ